MILVAVLAWALLTACGEYVLHEASFADDWRERRVSAKGWMSRMLACFACPWGWSSVGAGAWVGLCAWVWSVNPWGLLPLTVVSLPALGLGLSRYVVLLSPMSSMKPPEAK